MWWVAELEEVAREFRQKLKQIGEILVRIDVGERQLAYAKLSELGVSKSASEVAFRWACGSLGDDDNVITQAIGKVPFSTLRVMTAEVVHETVGNQHYIRTTRGNVEEKTFEKMTRLEVSSNISPQGFVPIQNNIRKEPEFRKCKAIDVILDNNNLVFVSRGRSETVRTEVSKALFLKALEIYEKLTSGRKKEA